ncbi:MAG TPA: histidine kinase dimerization/phospho-acceptor domain-containing protein, partial [Planctomycetaceae bacterium]|nr:histidine kinase dimerization/phospho-acceptor domain-containing protein [Planctomycetaceae bacterium]
MNSPHEKITSSDPLRWELAAESITVRIRWFGLFVGYVLVNFVGRETNQPVLNGILTLGAVYALLDSWWSVRGRVFLKEWPLLVSSMEAIFIGFLCYFDDSVHSPFRFYYFLSLLVCAMRHSPWITYTTFSLHAISYTALVFAGLPLERTDLTSFFLTQIFMIWVTWASTELASLVNLATRRLSELNDELKENQTHLEERITERTLELQESQAMLVQQEKQAAFGLLAAGIAHEVGNPLAAISSLVQMLNRKQIDDYTREQLHLVDDQLRRIQSTLRELLDFSRPANTEKTLCDVHEMIDSALNIAKYYKRKKGKQIVTEYDKSLPQLRIVRDQLVQVFLNLILNALDATQEGATIKIVTGS